MSAAGPEVAGIERYPRPGFREAGPGEVHPEFPASSPSVLSCGGTTLIAA